jgi:hypothetical protein
MDLCLLFKNGMKVNWEHAIVECAASYRSKQQDVRRFVFEEADPESASSSACTRCNDKGVILDTPQNSQITRLHTFDHFECA